MQLSEAIVSIMEEDDGEIELGRLIEPCLMAKHSMKLFVRMVKLNLACLEQEPESRPSMAEKVSSPLKVQVNVWYKCGPIQRSVDRCCSMYMFQKRCILLSIMLFIENKLEYKLIRRTGISFIRTIKQSITKTEKGLMYKDF
jgi:hypothetical protein